MWICPNCKRSFRNKNQWHSCAVVPEEVHLGKTSQPVQQLYGAIREYLDTLGSYEVSSIKTCINFRNGATFLSCKLKKEYLELEFSLPYHYEGFPMKKVVRVSGERYFYVLPIDDVALFDDQVKKWLHDAWILVHDQYQKKR